jgi:hypothetical protein
MINKFKEEHQSLSAILASLRQPSLSDSERIGFLSVLRKSLASHTKEEVEYFYTKYPNKIFSDIFNNNFNTTYFQVMDTLDSILESDSGYGGDIEFVCNSLEARIILEEEVLFKLGEDDMKDDEEAFYNEQSKQLKTVLNVFLINQKISSSGVVFIKRKKIQKKTRQECAEVGKLPILVMVLNGTLIRLKERDDDLWKNLTDLIVLMGFKWEYHEERYIIICE